MIENSITLKWSEIVLHDISPKSKGFRPLTDKYRREKEKRRSSTKACTALSKTV